MLQEIKQDLEILCSLHRVAGDGLGEALGLVLALFDEIASWGDPGLALQPGREGFFLDRHLVGVQLSCPEVLVPVIGQDAQIAAELQVAGLGIPAIFLDELLGLTGDPIGQVGGPDDALGRLVGENLVEGGEHGRKGE